MSSYIGAAKRTITDGRRRPYVPTTVADGCRSDGLGRAPLLLPRPLLDPLSSEGRNGIPFPKEKDFSSPPRSYPAHLTFERDAIVENDNRLGIYVGPFLSTLTAFPLSLPEETFLPSFFSIRRSLSQIHLLTPTTQRPPFLSSSCLHIKVAILMFCSVERRALLPPIDLSVRSCVWPLYTQSHPVKPFSGARWNLAAVTL